MTDAARIEASRVILSKAQAREERRFAANAALMAIRAHAAGEIDREQREVFFARLIAADDAKRATDEAYAEAPLALVPPPTPPVPRTGPYYVVERTTRGGNVVEVARVHGRERDSLALSRVPTTELLTKVIAHHTWKLAGEPLDSARVDLTDLENRLSRWIEPVLRRASDREHIPEAAVEAWRQGRGAKDRQDRK